MKIRYDPSQDITLFLSEEEHEVLLSLKGPTKAFHDIHTVPYKIEPRTKEIEIPFKGISHELKAYIFLGYSHNKNEVFENADKLEDRLGEISISSLDSYPWKINLSKKGVKYYQEGWSHGMRYNGTNKLFIKGPKNAMD